MARLGRSTGRPLGPGVINVRLLVKPRILSWKILVMTMCSHASLMGNMATLFRIVLLLGRKADESIIITRIVAAEASIMMISQYAERILAKHQAAPLVMMIQADSRTPIRKFSQNLGTAIKPVEHRVCYQMSN